MLWIGSDRCKRWRYSWGSINSTVYLDEDHDGVASPKGLVLQAFGYV